jgi:hypothetical protein
MTNLKYRTQDSSMRVLIMSGVVKKYNNHFVFILRVVVPDLLILFNFCNHLLNRVQFHVNHQNRSLDARYFGLVVNDAFGELLHVNVLAAVDYLHIDCTTIDIELRVDYFAT